MEDNTPLYTIVLCMTWKKLTKSEITENGKKYLKKLLRQFNIQQIREGMEIAVSTIKEDTDGKYNTNDLERTFNMLGGICYNRSLNPLENKKLHLSNLIKKIHGNKETKLVEQVVNNLFIELSYISSNELQIEIVDKMIFPIVKDADDMLECLISVETFINEKLCK